MTKLFASVALLPAGLAHDVMIGIENGQIRGEAVRRRFEATMHRLLGA